MLLSEDNNVNFLHGLRLPIPFGIRQDIGCMMTCGTKEIALKQPKVLVVLFVFCMLVLVLLTIVVVTFFCLRELTPIWLNPFLWVL